MSTLTMNDRHYCSLEITQTKVFVTLNSLLMLIATGFIAFNSVVISRFGDITETPVFAIPVFSLVIHIFLLLTALIGCYGYYNRDFTSLLVQSLFLCLILSFTVMGAVFFSVFSETIVGGTGAGFIKVASDIEDNFEVQVFNDCCITFLDNNVDPIDPIADFSLGDIVNDDLCQILVDNEALTSVGNLLDDSCGGDVFNFNVFQNDFDNFTRKFFRRVASFLWLEISLITVSLLFTWHQLCCVAVVAVDEDQFDTDFTKLDENSENKLARFPPSGVVGTSMPPPAVLPPPQRPPPQRQLMIPPTFRLTTQQKQFVSRISAKIPPPPKNFPAFRASGVQERQPEASMPPPAPRFPGFKNAISRVSNTFTGKSNAQAQATPSGMIFDPPMQSPAQNDVVDENASGAGGPKIMTNSSSRSANGQIKMNSMSSAPPGFSQPPGQNSKSPPTLPSMSQKPKFGKYLTRLSFGGNKKSPPTLPSMSMKPNAKNSNAMDSLDY